MITVSYNSFSRFERDGENEKNTVTKMCFSMGRTKKKEQNLGIWWLVSFQF